MRKHTTKFYVRVNGRKQREIEVATGVYISAAAAVPALLGSNDYPLEIEIWVPHLLPEYGPYTYYIESPGSSVDTLLGPQKVRVRTT